MNSAIVGKNDKHLEDVSEADCASACLKETDFQCLSFDYYKGKNKCDLSRATTADGSVPLSKKARYDHYTVNRKN